MYWHKTPALLGSIFSDVLWKVPTNKNDIYLTFDDGPVPDATEWVLEELDKFSIQATFFMVGENVHKHDEVYKSVLNRGHSIGNHSHNHLNGWRTRTNTYVENINKCEKLLETTNRMFRPPHGRLQWQQYKTIKKTYKVVMWDVLSGDFDNSLSEEKCLNKSIQGTVGGSIIVFHDSVKSIKKVKFVLPRYLDHFTSKGFNFKPL